MLEITNKTKSPLQLMLRSRKKVNGFGLTVLPGMGKGKNKIVIRDEEMTPQIQSLRDLKLLTIRETRVSDKQNMEN